jgi:hypothetical protein
MRTVYVNRIAPSVAATIIGGSKAYPKQGIKGREGMVRVYLVACGTAISLVIYMLLFL